MAKAKVGISFVEVVFADGFVVPNIMCHVRLVIR